MLPEPPITDCELNSLGNSDNELENGTMEHFGYVQLAGDPDLADLVEMRVDSESQEDSDDSDAVPEQQEDLRVQQEELRGQQEELRGQQEELRGQQVEKEAEELPPRPEMEINSEQIKSVMENITLPPTAIPDWATNVPEDVWKAALLNLIQSRK